jgi:hypothetical protein
MCRGCFAGTPPAHTAVITFARLADVEVDTTRAGSLRTGPAVRTATTPSIAIIVNRQIIMRLTSIEMGLLEIPTVPSKGSRQPHA